MTFTPEFSWFLPTSGDAELIGDPATQREASFEYLRDVARAAERAGFTAALVPVGDVCQDAWVVAGLLAGQTERLRYLVAVRPGFVAPTVAAKMVATFDRLSGGRMLVNVVTGGYPAELAADGDFTGHDDRYRRTDEYIEVMRKYWTERRFDHDGEFFRVAGARPYVKPATLPYPPIYAGGASPIAEDVFARQADCYLLWGESTPMLAERIARMRVKAAAAGRELRFGVRMHIIARETHDEARVAAEAQIAGLSTEQIERTQAVLNATDSAGESRQRAFLGADDYWVEENVWSGIALARRGVGVAVTGSYEEVARKFVSYVDMGISFFILSGYPHLEEAERAGGTWMPRFYELVRGREGALVGGGAG